MVECSGPSRHSVLLLHSALQAGALVHSQPLAPLLQPEVSVHLRLMHLELLPAAALANLALHRSGESSLVLKISRPLSLILSGLHRSISLFRLFTARPICPSS